MTEIRTGIYAEFASADAMLAALAATRASGLTKLDSYSPFPLPEAAEAIAIPRSRLPIAVFIGGFLGAAGGYFIQYYANVIHYPQNAGGRPANAIPSFIFSTFEGMILVAAFAAVIAFLVSLRLPRLWHPAFEIDGFESASLDAFWLAIDEHDPRFDGPAITRALEARGALRILRVEGR